MRKLIAAFLSFILGACATPDVASDYKIDRESKQGVVTGSVSYVGRPSGYRVYFRQIPGGYSGSFGTGAASTLLPFSEKGDFNDQHGLGTVFAAALPPGEYEIFSWAVASGYANVRSTVPFSIRFTVEPGKLVYLGNFQFRQTAGLGLTVTGATVSYREAIARDIPVFKRKFPGLSETPIAYAVEAGMNRSDLGGQSATIMTIPIFLPVR